MPDVYGRDFNGLPLTCQKCGSSRLKVKETRDHNHNRRRKRECYDCKTRFYTMEIICDRHCEPIGSTE